MVNRELSLSKISMKSILLLSLIALHLPLFAQTNFTTENEEFIGWQPGTTFDFQDYQAEKSEHFLKLTERFDYSTVTNIQVFAYLDVPRKKSQRRKKLEQVYIAPVFCKQCSFALKEDSTELKQDQVYFMIAEFAARVGRMNFDSLRISIPGTGIYAIKFMELRNDMLDMLQQLYARYTQDIMIDKRDGAYEEWVTKLNAELKKLEQYATKPEDCHRIITGQPILDDYILAPTVGGDPKGRNY